MKAFMEASVKVFSVEVASVEAPPWKLLSCKLSWKLPWKLLPWKLP